MRVTTPVFARSKRTALATIASNTGCTSVCERLITRRMSLVAVCVSSAVVSSRLLAWSSLNSRTFSMAITAWSAKVFSSSIWVREKGPGCPRLTTIAPMGRPSRSMGAASMLRKPPARATSFA
jgi:hypothetical protein